MDNYTTWVGYGAKMGGILGLVGVESTDGKVCNLGYTTEVYPVSLTSLRLGLGLGGGAGVVAMFVFNCINIQDMHDTSPGDWCINVSLAGKWSDIVKGIKHTKMLKFYAALARTGGDLTNASPQDITRIRNIASYYYSIVEANGLMPGNPSLMILDIPTAGIGAELSASWQFGKILVGEVQRAIPEESESDMCLPDGSRG